MVTRSTPFQEVKRWITAWKTHWLCFPVAVYLHDKSWPPNSPFGCSEHRQMKRNGQNSPCWHATVPQSICSFVLAVWSKWSRSNFPKADFLANDRFTSSSIWPHHIVDKTIPQTIPLYYYKVITPSLDLISGQFLHGPSVPWSLFITHIVIKKKNKYFSIWTKPFINKEPSRLLVHEVFCSHLILISSISFISIF